VAADPDPGRGLLGLLAVSVGLCCGLPILLGAEPAVGAAGLILGSGLLVAAGIALGGWASRRRHPLTARRATKGPGMSTPSIADPRTIWTTRPVFSNGAVNRAAIALLADGKPATAEALAIATGMTAGEVTAYIATARSRGVEVENGAIVGAALTLHPTGHRFRVRGNDLYTWCGFDALFLPIMLGERAEVASTCPVTGAAITLTVQADGTVSSSAPTGAVVGIVGQNITSCCPTSGPQSAVCTQMPFFASRDAARRWLADHPGVAILDLDDASEIARAYADTGAYGTESVAISQ
jgi:alkylmercury lyase